jgi:hypothetical protein
MILTASSNIHPFTVTASTSYSIYSTLLAECAGRGVRDFSAASNQVSPVTFNVSQTKPTGPDTQSRISADRDVSLSEEAPDFVCIA